MTISINKQQIFNSKIKSDNKDSNASGNSSELKLLVNKFFREISNPARFRNLLESA